MQKFIFEIMQVFHLDGWYLFTIVHFQGACSVHEVFVQKKWNPQPCQVCLGNESVLLSSNRKCSLQTVHFHQTLNSYKLGLCVLFKCPAGLAKQLMIMNLKAIQVICCGGTALENGSKQLSIGN